MTDHNDPYPFAGRQHNQLPQDESPPRPFRRVFEVIETRDPQTGQIIRMTLGGTESVIHPDGCTDQYRITTGDTWSCGHPMTVPFGGRCFESSKLVCMNCFTQCAICGKPLSREYALTVDAYDLCKQHAGQIRRGRLLRRIAKTILSPFIDFTGGPRR